MTIEKGSVYGRPGPLPEDGVVVSTDGQARAAAEAARREGRPLPPLGLLGGDLAATLGGGGLRAGSGSGTGDGPGDGPGDGEARLRSGAAVCFPVDLGEVLVDGHLHYFVAHLVARTPTWSYAFVAMNAQWMGRWNLGPRAHPGDGLIDTYEARLGPADRLKVRSRLHHGTHLPHPGVRERRVAALQLTLPRSLPVRLDGTVVAEGRSLSLRVMPDALSVVV